MITIANAADASKWINILSLIEILFCLPVANGTVERMFSNLKTNSLSEYRLDHLVRIAVDGPPLYAKPAVNLWWKSKQCREVHDTRTKPRPSTSCGTEDSTSTAYRNRILRYVENLKASAQTASSHNQLCTQNSVRSCILLIDTQS